MTEEQTVCPSSCHTEWFIKSISFNLSIIPSVIANLTNWCYERSGDLLKLFKNGISLHWNFRHNCFLYTSNLTYISTLHTVHTTNVLDQTIQCSTAVLLSAAPCVDIFVSCNWKYISYWMMRFSVIMTKNIKNCTSDFLNDAQSHCESLWRWT